MALVPTTKFVAHVTYPKLHFIMKHHQVSWLDHKFLQGLGDTLARKVHKGLRLDQF